MYIKIKRFLVPHGAIPIAIGIGIATDTAIGRGIATDVAIALGKAIYMATAPQGRWG